MQVAIDKTVKTFRLYNRWFSKDSPEPLSVAFGVLPCLGTASVACFGASLFTAIGFVALAAQMYYLKPTKGGLPACNDPEVYLKNFFPYLSAE